MERLYDLLDPTCTNLKLKTSQDRSFISGGTEKSIEFAADVFKVGLVGSVSKF